MNEIRTLQIECATLMKLEYRIVTRLNGKQESYVLYSDVLKIINEKRKRIKELKEIENEN